MFNEFPVGDATSLTPDYYQAQSEALSLVSRFLVQPAHREECAIALADHLNKAHDPALKTWDINEPHTRELRDQGVTFFDFGISASVAAELCAFLKAPEDHGARYTIPTARLIAAPRLLEIATSEEVLSVVAGLLGTPPLLANLSSWWSFGWEGGGDQVFHRDWHSLKFCKLFIYLTDVDRMSGPHQFVARSQHPDHIKARIKHVDRETYGRLYTALFMGRLFQTDEQIVLDYLSDDIMTHVGPAGTAFLENTYAMHKAIPPTQGRSRLVFQALYSISLDPPSQQEMADFKTDRSWIFRVPNTPLSRFAVSPWMT
jgi:hypothetical protein